MDGGNVRIADSRNGRVVEVTEGGSEVREYTIPMIGTMRQPCEADQLDSGNILISCAGAVDGDLYEVDDSTQTVVWSFP